MDKIVNLHDYRQPQEETKKPVKKKRRIRRWVKKLLLIIVLITAVVIFLRSPLFTVKEIQVTGNENVSYGKIIDLAEISADETLFKMNKKDISARLTAYPFIEQAEIKRRLPSTLVIEISEREPIGFIVTSNGYVQFDKTGMVLAIVGSMGKYNLPIITGIDMAEIPSPGSILEGESFQNALNVIKNCDPQVLSNIAEINIGENSYVVAHTYQGIEIKIGTDKDINLRLNDLRDILAEIAAENIDIADIEYIDIRYKDVPVIKFKD